MRKQRHTAYTICPVEAALDVIGGKWKSIILFRLMEGTRRFNELRRPLPSVTQRTLTNQFRELERDGLVHRTVFAEIPPRVEYRLTPLGESLEPVLRELRSWAEQHMQPLVPDER
ncbi:MAG: helix-turn-helix transcriptional regulator [Betaproteobacteria bacterium]|nr:helix-turn-helix transcriptional regulator [Betaproteobacteria bacterium]